MKTKYLLVLNAKMISIIIVNWNTVNLTTQCIESIRKHCLGFDYEVILVDNASTDGSGEFFSTIPQIRFIQNQHNIGFAKANNIGMKNARGDVLLLLNSDTIILDDSIQRSYHYLLSHSEVAMVGCRLLNEDRTLQRSCSNYPCLLTPILGRHLFVRFMRKAFPDLSFKFASAYLDIDHEFVLSPDWIMGAFMMVRREAIDQVGVLDEDYFMYAEDMDWCYRFKKSGWKIQYIPEPAIVHLGGGSSVAVPRRTLARNTASQLMYFYKHHGLLASRLYALTSIIGLLSELFLRILARILFSTHNKNILRQIPLKIMLMSKGFFSIKLLFKYM